MLLLLLACATCDLDSVPRVEDTDGLDPFDVTTTVYTCEDTPGPIEMGEYTGHSASVCWHSGGPWECEPLTVPQYGEDLSNRFCVTPAAGCDGGLGMVDLCEQLEQDNGAVDARLVLNRVR